MDTEALINTVLNYTDNVSSSDADYSARRTRILQTAQEVCEEVWNFTEWPFTYKRNTAYSLTASVDEVDLPSDFLELGRHGGLWENAGDHRWLEVGYQELSDLRDGSTLTVPRVFCIYGMNDSTMARRIQILSSGSTRTMTLIYRFLFPTLVDVSDPASELLQIPVQYHQTVVLAGVVARTREAKNELRDWDARYRNGLAYMTAREIPTKSRASKVPRAINNW